jgi:hypothetical protein
MFVNPFLAGVLTTIFAELAIMFIASLTIIFKRGKRYGNS